MPRTIRSTTSRFVPLTRHLNTEQLTSMTGRNLRVYKLDKPNTNLVKLGQDIDPMRWSASLTLSKALSALAKRISAA